MKEKVSVLNVIKFAGAYIAFTFGSGFATGQEILQFFAAYGQQAIVAALVGMAIFASMGAALMVKGYDLQLKVETSIFRYYCGKYIGIALEVFTIVSLFCVVSVMIAGTGAIAVEYFGINGEIGKILMAIICVITVLLGLNKLVDIIGTIGPFITVFTIFMGVFTFATSQYFGNSLTDAQLANFWDLRATAGWWFSRISIFDRGWFSGILYAACMVLGGIPFLTGLGKTANSRKEAALGGILGGVLLMVSVIAIVLAMFCYPDEIVTLEVPTLFLAKKSLPFLATLFSVTLLLGIFSTAAPMFYLVINRIQGFGFNKKIMLVVTVLLGMVAYFGSSIGFGQLIGLLYPLMGQVGVIMIPVVLLQAKRSTTFHENL